MTSTDEDQIFKNSLISEVETACTPNKFYMSFVHRTYRVLS